MDKITRIEEIQKELKEVKGKDIARYEKATEKLSGLLKKYPDIKEDKSLQFMIVYSYLHIGDKIDEEITPAFREYDGPYKILSSKLKRDPKSIMSYLFLSLDNLVMKSERSHNVYVLMKKAPRPVKVTNKDTGQKEDRKVMNVTLWVDDMKAMATLGVWDTQIPMYDGISEDKTYKMQLNFNGQNFFPPKDPMAKEFQFTPDYAEMLKFITENYTEMREPYSALENAEAGKSFYIIGRVLKEAGFKWNPTNRRWETTDEKAVEKLIQILHNMYEENQIPPEKRYDIITSSVREEIERRKEKMQETLQKSLSSTSNIEVPSPSGLKYLPFQKAGIDFINQQKNVLVADEMGLGKTIQAIGYINLSDVKSVLVICPASLKINWKQELEKWLVRPFKVDILNGDGIADITITNYESVKKYFSELTSRNWDLLVLDESHYIKNYKAQRTKYITGFYQDKNNKVWIKGLKDYATQRFMYPIA